MRVTDATPVLNFDKSLFEGSERLLQFVFKIDQYLLHHVYLLTMVKGLTSPPPRAKPAEPPLLAHEVSYLSP
jgi:hypothetical protein